MALTPGAVSLTSRSSTSIVVAGAVATGGSGTYTYQWYRSTGVDNVLTALGGATTASSVTDSTVSSGQLYAYVLYSTDTGTPANGSVASATVGPVLAYSPTTAGTASYTASVTGFTPVATPTDIFNIFGSNSKTISITRLEISGITSAATAITLDAQVFRRSTAGTLGSAVLTGLTAVPLDANNAAASAVVSTVGTANYTTLGTSTGLILSKKLPLTLSPATATDFPVNGVPVAFTFNDAGTQNCILRGTSQQIAINLNSASLPAGTALNILIEWTEQ